MTEDDNWRIAEEFGEVLERTEGESDRGIVLVITAHIEWCLRRILEGFLIESSEVKDLFEGAYAPFGSLSGKTQAAFVMGLITRAEREEIDVVRAVRNVFAHEITADFNHPRVKKICARHFGADPIMCVRDEFLHLAQNAVLPLMHRHLDIAVWRRTELIRVPSPLSHDS